MSNAYRYCPYCSTPLVYERAFDKVRPLCPSCGFVQFYDPKVAVIGLVESQQHVLLIRRGVDPGKGQWALPGGYMDAGEMPHDALARELAEEVGIEVEIGPFLGVYPMAATDRIAGGIVLAYGGRPAQGDLPALETNDDAESAGWFSGDDLPQPIAFASSRELLDRWRSGLLDATQAAQIYSDRKET